MRVACGFDHAGVPLEDAVLSAIRGAGHEPVGIGCWDDYPDTALAVARAVLRGGAPEPERPPQPWSLEGLAAGRALDRLGRAHGFPDGHEVVRAAKAGDAAARDCLRILGERLGIGIASMILALEPELVVIGGGVSSAGELLMEPARRVARAYLLEGLGTRTEIRLARYGPQAGVRGAALLARQELEED